MTEVCKNCLAVDGPAVVHAVEILSPAMTSDGRTFWQVEGSAWCDKCLRGALLMGTKTFHGRITFGVKRPRGAAGKRIRLYKRQPPKS